MANATLMTHCGAHGATRSDLALVAPPKSMGPRHKPVPHLELVDTLTEILHQHNLNITREEFALYRDNAILFGVMDLESTNGLNRFKRDGQGFSLGLRSGNDQSMSIQIAVGQRIFVCDNLCFSGDVIALKRKHTLNINLRGEINEGIQRYKRQVGDLTELSDRAKGYGLTRREARDLIYDHFANDVLPARLFKPVHRTYFEPEAEWTDVTGYPDTLWSLHNAFTRCARVLKPARRFEATTKLGRLLEVGLN